MLYYRHSPGLYWSIVNPKPGPLKQKSEKRQDPLSIHNRTEKFYIIRVDVSGSRILRCFVLQ